MIYLVIIHSCSSRTNRRIEICRALFLRSKFHYLLSLLLDQLLGLPPVRPCRSRTTPDAGTQNFAPLSDIFYLRNKVRKDEAAPCIDQRLRGMIRLMEKVAHIISLDAIYVLVYDIGNFLFCYRWVINPWNKLLLVKLEPSEVGGNNDYSASFRE